MHQLTTVHSYMTCQTVWQQTLIFLLLKEVGKAVQKLWNGHDAAPDNILPEPWKQSVCIVLCQRFFKVGTSGKSTIRMERRHDSVRIQRQRILHQV